MLNLWLLEDGRGEKNHPFYSNCAHTHFWKGGKGNLNCSIFLQPIFQLLHWGRNKSSVGFPFILVQLRRRAVIFQRIDWRVHLLVHLSVTARTKRGRREGAGCLERRRALSSSHRKKSLLWSLEHNKALLPCTSGPGQRIIPIMQHVWLPESPMARLIQLEEDRARDVMEYTPNPWHTLFLCPLGLDGVALEPGFQCTSQLTLYAKNALQL